MIAKIARSVGIPLIYAVVGLSTADCVASDQSADLIFHNANIWTVDSTQPTAQAVAVKGNRIVRVGSNTEVLALKATTTELIDLNGQFLMPGFIDAHTHFENAVLDYFHMRLNDVNDEKSLLEILQKRVADVPEIFWITGGDWSAASGRGREESGADTATFSPSLDLVDKLTPDRPVLLSRYDGAYFMNSAGFERMHITKDTPDPSGGHYEHDPVTGELTGMMYGTAGPRLVNALPPDSRAKIMFGAQAMVRKLNRHGIVGIHDIARVPEISDQQVFQTNVERSASDVSIFTRLRDENHLSVRVYPVLTLRTWSSLNDAAITPRSGDDTIRYGALKMFLDGFLMFRPYANNPQYSGSLSFRNIDGTQLRREVVAADAAGWDIAAHVTGDKGHAMVLDYFEAARQSNKSRARRDRAVHAWYPRMAEIQRGGKLGLIGDITPYHLIREMSAMTKKLHPDQISTAFAWKTMIREGWRINIVSDWPGSYDGSHAAPLNPLENIYYAITRRRVGDEPSDSFNPAESLTIDQAIEAYTINPAYSSWEEDSKGSISVGKLADMVVLSNDIRKIAPVELLRTEVLTTVFDGKIVYSAAEVQP
tara:strand:- start:10417 stop:12198 length:1782 start_codon:yes stop_codon:yes gene_type:complete